MWHARLRMHIREQDFKGGSHFLLCVCVSYFIFKSITSFNLRSVMKKLNISLK